MKIKELIACVFLLNASVYAQVWEISNMSKLSGSINSAACEESIPVFSKDSSILYFVRTYHPKAVGGEFDQDIWYSKRGTDGSYDEGKLLKDLNNKYFNAVLGLGADGNTMYVFNSYEGKKDLQKGLAKSTKKGASWSKPKEVVIPGLDIEGDYYGFHVAESEDVIIISYTGPSSLGSEDLYASLKQGDQWSTPIHLGSTVNTSGFEISPFLSKTKDTLFFSSNGHGGLGDADIFYSVRQGSGWDNWSVPVNMGNVVNSPKFDAYFSISGSTCYWSSNRDGERSDLYMGNRKMPLPVNLTCSGIDVTENGGANGELNALASGGVPPYSYQWTNGSNEQNPRRVKAGKYLVAVIDAIGQKANCGVTINEPIIRTYENFTLRNFFEYNGDKMVITEGKLKSFAENIENQLVDGRKNVTVYIFSSASRVPTATFKTNENLAISRANRIQLELATYFSDKGLADKVKIIIDGTAVQGPEYQFDSGNTEKYQPFQYVDLRTE